MHQGILRAVRCAADREVDKVSENNDEGGGKKRGRQGITPGFGWRVVGGFVGFFAAGVILQAAGIIGGLVAVAVPLVGAAVGVWVGDVIGKARASGKSS